VQLTVRPNGCFRKTPELHIDQRQSQHWAVSDDYLNLGAMDGDMFIAYVTHVLLKELRPGDVVVMDNLPAHKVAGVRSSIERAGAKLMYLPAYSPDFNPIEKAFSQIKAFLKKTAARTKEKLDAAIAAAIDVVSPQNAVNYFAACGYESDTV